MIASDGDIEEGVTSEASSLAGTQQLGNLTVVYDDNKISIEDDTTIALSEDTAKRYEAYGWHVQVVEGGENVTGILEALENARAETDRPSFILLRTVIAFPAPKAMNTGKAHGSALGDAEVQGRQGGAGLRPRASPSRSTTRCSPTPARSSSAAPKAHEEWTAQYESWAAREPERKELLDRMLGRDLPVGWEKALPSWEPDKKGVATRKASGEVLKALADVLPELWGGSADLAESNNTTMEGANSFGPKSIATKMWDAEPYGRTLHFGVREHAMGAILNGIALHGPTRPYGGTFLTFSDYMRGAVRLAAVMKSPVDLRVDPRLHRSRRGRAHPPADRAPGRAARHPEPRRSCGPATRTRPRTPGRRCWRTPRAPKGIALTRQNIPVLEGTSAEGVARGGYVLADASNGDPQLVLIGTGSELQIAVDAREVLEGDGIPTRVVSMPCMDWFAAQDQEYRDSVLPPSVKARVSVEAGIAMPWYRWVGDAGEIVSIEHYGASADYQTLFREFGFTTEHVVTAARTSLDRVSPEIV